MVGDTAIRYGSSASRNRPVRQRGRVVITFEEFEAQWLEDVQAESPSTTQLGNRFAQKILRDWHEIDEVAAEVILCDGAGDGGIDAAVFVKADPAEGIDGSTWILVQSKYGTALSGPNTITLEAQKLFATLEGRRPSLSSVSTELVERLKTFLSNKGDADKLEYVVATSRKLTDEESGIPQECKSARPRQIWRMLRY